MASIAAPTAESMSALNAQVAADAPETQPMLELTPAQPRVITVPEPGTLLLVGTGLVGLAFTVRRRRTNK